MYAIIDIETTGGNPREDKITEIAVVIHDGTRKVSEYSTLVHPERRIPHHITALTGITNEMVADAPRFFEIARELVELTRDKVFVAHNVAFDYGFVRSEFQRLGYEYKREQLCTGKLSRKLIPGHRSYSLGRICEDLNIVIQGRHRALGDALATSSLFDILLKTDALNAFSILQEPSRYLKDNHPMLDPVKIKNLPEEPGVYYFYNQEAELIYIGKSKNIRSRVSSHFSGSANGKELKLCSQVADIDCESTGSELIALLKESFEIKQYKPLFNRKQRRSLFRYELVSYTDDRGYIRFELQKTTSRDDRILMSFTSKAEARNVINRMIEKYHLCQKLCGQYPSDGNCFHYEIGACKGACIGKEAPELYNIRAGKAIERLTFSIRNLLIVDSGRTKEEKSVIKIENGKYMGFGYFTPEYAESYREIMHACIHEYPDNREVQQIIRQYLRSNKVDRVIEY